MDRSLIGKDNLRGVQIWLSWGYLRYSYALAICRGPFGCFIQECGNSMENYVVSFRFRWSTCRSFNFFLDMEDQCQIGLAFWGYNTLLILVGLAKTWTFYWASFSYTNSAKNLCLQNCKMLALFLYLWTNFILK